MLVSLAEIKAYLGIDPSDTTQDAFLTLRGQVTSDAVELYCARVFTAADYVETMYADDYPMDKEMKLYQYPVNSIASITLSTVPLTDYRVAKEYGIITRLCGWFNCSRDVLVVTYNAGYTTIPAIIQSVILQIVEGDYNKKKAGIDVNFGNDVQRISVPGVVAIDFDYSLENNNASATMGSILGNYVNLLTPFRSERAIVGNGHIAYVS